MTETSSAVAQKLARKSGALPRCRPKAVRLAGHHSQLRPLPSRLGQYGIFKVRFDDFCRIIARANDLKHNVLYVSKALGMGVYPLASPDENLYSTLDGPMDVKFRFQPSAPGEGRFGSATKDSTHLAALYSRIDLLCYDESALRKALGLAEGMPLSAETLIDE